MSVTSTTTTAARTVPAGKTAKPRGFAALVARGDMALMRAIARKGAAASAPTRHRWTSEEARRARARVGARRTSAATAVA